MTLRLYLNFICMLFSFSTIAQVTHNNYELDSNYPYLDVEESFVPNLAKKLKKSIPVTIYLFPFHEGRGTFDYNVTLIRDQQELERLNELAQKDTVKALRLEFNDFSNLSLPELNSLEFLDIVSYRSKKLPRNINKLKNLKFLKISLSELESLPDYLGELTNLERLIIDYNDNLIHFPKTLEQLVNLKHLELSRMHKIEELPMDISKFSRLENLVLMDNSFSITNNSISRLINLKELNIDSYAPQISSLTKLELLRIQRSITDEETKEISKINSLKELFINLEEEHSAIHISNLKNLKVLSIKSNITQLPKELESLSKLQYIHIFSEKLHEIPLFIENLKEIRYIRINTFGHKLKVPYKFIKNCPALYYDFIGDIELDFKPKIEKELPSSEKEIHYIGTIESIKNKKLHIYKWQRYSK